MRNSPDINHTDMTGRLVEPSAVRDFALAGNATLTLRSRKTGTRYTYKVRGKANDGSDRHDIYFVSVMYGPDNEDQFAYLGTIRPGLMQYTHGRKSKITEADKRNIAFGWFWRAIAAGHVPSDLEVWHEGHCGRCGRKLTVPESVQRGLGPECASIHAIKRSA